MNQFDLFEHSICLSKPGRIAQSGWLAHIPFGMYLIELLGPRTILELGTHRGVSYCAFCQAVHELGLPTKCYAVDTWNGDAHTRYYSDEVFQELKAYHDPLYGSFSKLIRSDFDDAVNLFRDQSIDLLHIDGAHTYDAVKHDYETWYPKVSAFGVILLHDISVTESDFGVWRFWNEVKNSYSHFEFSHGFGLGVLVVGTAAEKLLRPLIDLSTEQSQTLTEFFVRAGSSIELAIQLEQSEDFALSQVEQIQKLNLQLHQIYQLHRQPIVRLALALNRYGVLGSFLRAIRKPWSMAG